jgi:DNA-binding beta-propeller fold protein YncE
MRAVNAFVPLLTVVFVAGPVPQDTSGPAGLPLAASGPGGAPVPAVRYPAGPPSGEPEATYWVYVLAESPDYIHRIRFGPDGGEVEATVRMAELYRQSGVGDLLTDHEDPHGIQVDPSGRYVYVTTGHGLPDGKIWKLEAGTERLLADPVVLGPFPASMDVSPDGGHAFAVNFNLHGDMVPSSVSAVSTPDMVAVAEIPTCAMPHGSRFHPSGLFHYSVCMMDDQLVEIDARRFAVSRRFFLGAGREGPLEPDDLGFHADLVERRGAHADHADHADRADPRTQPDRTRLPHEHAYHATCSPTWVQPAHAGDRIWVACNASDQVLEISFDEWAVTRRFATGRGPYNVDVTSDDRVLVVTLKQGDAVELVDLESGRSVRRETSTRVVHGIAISPDDRYAFVSVEGIGAEPGKVDVFDLETFELVESIAVGQMASGIAFWKMER